MFVVDPYFVTQGLLYPFPFIHLLGLYFVSVGLGVSGMVPQIHNSLFPSSWGYLTNK